MIKRLFDIIAAILGLLLLAPVIAVVTFQIRCKLGSPILFRQVRPGRDGKPFEMIKFRTMVVDAEKAGASWASKNDPRVTRMGKFMRKTRIDEIPQLLNVLKGDMSFVGPRPDLQGFADELKGDDRIILIVKPGITGLAQVSGYRGEIKKKSDIKNRVRFDIFYIENWSFLLDIKIILMTVFNVFKGDENAY